MKDVKAIETRNGETVYNLACSASNDDSIRAARMVKAGKKAALKELDEAPVYYRDEKTIKKMRESR